MALAPVLVGAFDVITREPPRGSSYPTLRRRVVAGIAIGAEFVQRSALSLHHPGRLLNRLGTRTPDVKTSHQTTWRMDPDDCDGPQLIVVWRSATMLNSLLLKFPLLFFLSFLFFSFLFFFSSFLLYSFFLSFLISLRISPLSFSLAFGGL